MIYLCLVLAWTAAAYFAVRFFMLKRAIKKADKELRKIAGEIEVNRIVKLTQPDKSLEKLLETMNAALDSMRERYTEYQHKEELFKQQIENISHDLRTPLTTVLGYLQIMDKEQMSADDRESLETVKRKAYALERLIAQFYDLSRLDNGDYQLKSERVDAAYLLRESVMDQYQLLDGRDLEVTVDIPVKPVFVAADPNALERIYLNLLQNAGRYAKVSFVVTCKQENKNLLIVFRNDTDETFSGISAEKVFDRFYQADTARSQGSTGLGITIARDLTRAMGGDLTARFSEKDGRRWIEFILKMKVIG